MILGVMTFSKRGQKTAEDLFEKCKEISPLYYDGDMPREAWIRDKFSYHIPLLFVGATGIAVRLIAPFVEDKLRDSAVIVMDQRGRHVIPLLSGHMGGANEIARNLADRVGAEVILTTATDVEDLFAVDVFARRNGFCICDRLASAGSPKGCWKVKKSGLPLILRLPFSKRICRKGCIW